MVPHFRIEGDGNAAYRFVFVAASGTIFLSRSIPTVEAARTSIERLRTRLAHNDWAQRQVSVDGPAYSFSVEGDGDLVGSSVLYDSRYARELAIEQMQLDGPAAPVMGPAD